MFSRTKGLLGANQKLILTLLLAASPAIFTAAGCGTWNKGVTGPMAAQTLTTTPAITSTPSTTPTKTRTGTPTQSPTNTTSPVPTATPTITPTGTPTGTPSLSPTTTSSATPTSTISCPNPVAVVLGSAGNYTILAETGITDVPSSAVTGNIANSGTGTQIGLSCAEVNGTIFEIDGTGPSCFVQATTAINTAITDMDTAYMTANGEPNCVTELGAGTLSGLTLPRGKYFWSSAVNITTNLHLDAMGDPTATWIFQVGGTLSLASGVSIIMDNGGLPQNVTWTVADTTAIGSGAFFEGVVLDAKDITLVTGATVLGRLLAQTDVTLQQNAITQP